MSEVVRDPVAHEPGPARLPPTAVPEGPRTTPVTQSQGEVNGPKGPEPTRFGDWEKGGRCSDF